MKPKQGFLPNLSKVKHDDPNLVKRLKFTKRCHEKYLANDFFEEKEPLKKRSRTSGG